LSLVIIPAKVSEEGFLFFYLLLLFNSRDKNTHEGQLKELEAEMDNQVRQVEIRAKKKVEQELEAERKSVREKMKEEMDELHAHMQMFQKVCISLKC